MCDRRTRAALLLGLLAAVAATAGVVAAQESLPIAIAVNGVVQDLVPQPQMVGGRVLVPIRGVLELADAKVEWDAGDRSITVTRGEHRAVLVMDRRTISADGRPVVLDVPPKFIGGSVYVPLRAVAETLGATVRWNEARRMVMLTAPRLPKQWVRTEDPGAQPSQPPPEEVPAEPARPAPEEQDDPLSRNVMRASLSGWTVTAASQAA